MRKDKKDTTTRKYTKYICPLCELPQRRIHDHLRVGTGPHFIKTDEEYREVLDRKVLHQEEVQIKIVPKKNKKSTQPLASPRSPIKVGT